MKHLCWSLLGLPELENFKSVDSPSVTLAHFLYGAFMIIGVILLVNMMIALLSNTYQRVEVRYKIICSCVTQIIARSVFIKRVLIESTETCLRQLTEPAVFSTYHYDVKLQLTDRVSGQNTYIST